MILGPAINPTKAIEYTLNLLMKLKELDIEMIGSLEFADNRKANHWKNINSELPFLKIKHFANIHLHNITNQYYNKEHELFLHLPHKYQVFQQKEARGKYKDQSRDQFIEQTIKYGRKRVAIQTDDWFILIKDDTEQLTFMIKNNELFLWNFNHNEFMEYRQCDILLKEDSYVNGDDKAGGSLCESLNESSLMRVEEGSKNLLVGHTGLEMETKEIPTETTHETDQNNHKELVRTQQTVRPHTQRYKNNIDGDTLLELIKQKMKEHDNGRNDKD